jgi:hypothetical protein
MNAFVMDAVFAQATPRAQRSSPLDPTLAASLLAQAARIADGLRAADGSSDQIDECRRALTDIRTCLMRLLERDP